MNINQNIISYFESFYKEKKRRAAVRVGNLPFSLRSFAQRSHGVLRLKGQRRRKHR